MDAAQFLKNLHQVVSIPRSAGQGPFESRHGLVGLADENQGLSEIERGQGIAGPMLLGGAQRRYGPRFAAPLHFEEAQDHPGGAILWIFKRSVLVTLQEGVKESAFDVIAVNPIQIRTAPRRLLQQGQRALDQLAITFDLLAVRGGSSGAGLRLDRSCRACEAGFPYIG
jgi:hypothetical protein